jgi:hypothetical protein
MTADPILPTYINNGSDPPPLQAESSQPLPLPITTSTTITTDTTTTTATPRPTEEEDDDELEEDDTYHGAEKSHALLLKVYFHSTLTILVCIVPCLRYCCLKLGSNKLVGAFADLVNIAKMIQAAKDFHCDSFLKEIATDPKKRLATLYISADWLEMLSVCIVYVYKQ